MVRPSRQSPSSLLGIDDELYESDISRRTQRVSVDAL
jgi:hypothetical protein